MRQLSYIIKSMILEIVFALYFATLMLFTFLLGINMLKIRDKTGVHPKIVCFMTPFIVNVPIL